MATKEEIESLKRRASDVNNKIISLNTKKEIATKEIQSILEELGYNKDMKLDEVEQLLEKLMTKENEEFEAFKSKVEETEKIIEGLNLN